MVPVGGEEREQRLGGQQPVSMEVLPQGLPEGPLLTISDCIGTCCK